MRSRRTGAGIANATDLALSAYLDGFEPVEAILSVRDDKLMIRLPLALAVPGAIPLMPAVIVGQTLVELVASLIYIRLMPRLGA